MTVGHYQPEPHQPAPQGQMQLQVRHFDDLVRIAASEGPGQTLLVVLVSVQRTEQKGPDGQYHAAPNEGSLSPYMVRSFPLGPVTQLEEIVEAADEAGSDWEFLMMAVMAPRDGEPASEAQAEPHLTRMAQSLTTGEDLERFAFFTREGEPVEIRAGSS